MTSELDAVRAQLASVADPLALLTGLFANAPVGLQIYRADGLILNLAVNARDAMPVGGILTLQTSDVDVDVDANDELPAGAWVRISVADTGVGMDANTRTRLFEPFFTTKEQGKGTGLGLSTVYGIVEQSRGQILVDSEPGRGSTFAIYLPREYDPLRAAGARPPGETETLPGGQETILLAEDDEAVRDFVRFVLGKLGYRVLQACDGAEALHLARDFSGPIDLLLSDVVMPQMDGVELARQLVAMRPAMKVIHMSGYAGDSVPGDGATLLHKPFERELLARRVRTVLDGTA